MELCSQKVLQCSFALLFWFWHFVSWTCAVGGDFFDVSKYLLDARQWQWHSDLLFGLMTSLLESGKELFNLFHVADLQILCISLFSLHNMDTVLSLIPVPNTNTHYLYLWTPVKQCSGQDLFVINEILIKKSVYETWPLILSLSYINHFSLGPLSDLKGNKMHFVWVSKNTPQRFWSRGGQPYIVLGRLRMRRYHMNRSWNIWNSTLSTHMWGWG